MWRIVKSVLSELHTSPEAFEYATAVRQVRVILEAAGPSYNYQHSAYGPTRVKNFLFCTTGATEVKEQIETQTHRRLSSAFGSVSRK